jgi:hypothetical protein
MNVPHDTSTEQATPGAPGVCRMVDTDSSRSGKPGSIATNRRIRYARE